MDIDEMDIDEMDIDEMDIDEMDIDEMEFWWNDHINGYRQNGIDNMDVNEMDVDEKTVECLSLVLVQNRIKPKCGFVQLYVVHSVYTLFKT